MQPNEIIKKHIAPCGLHCGGCFAFNGGNIQKHSTELIKSLGNFDVYAQRFVTMLDEPVFENYQSFKMMLHYFSEPNATAAANRHVPCSKVAMSGIVSVRRVSIFVFNVPLPLRTNRVRRTFAKTFHLHQRKNTENRHRKLLRGDKRCSSILVLLLDKQENDQQSMPTGQLQYVNINI